MPQRIWKSQLLGGKPTQFMNPSLSNSLSQTLRVPCKILWALVLLIQFSKFPGCPPQIRDLFRPLPLAHCSQLPSILFVKHSLVSALPSLLDEEKSCQLHLGTKMPVWISISSCAINMFLKSEGKNTFLLHTMRGETYTPRRHPF